MLLILILVTKSHCARCIGNKIERMLFIQVHDLVQLLQRDTFMFKFDETFFSNMTV